MTKRGVVLVFSLLVVVVLSIILGAFFLKSINENNLVRRFVSSTQAFWVAESGVAQAMRNLPNSPTNGSLGNYRYETNTTYRTTISSSVYYNINSTGIVNLSTGGNVTRTLNVVVRTPAIDPSKFQYSLQAANGLCFGGLGGCKCPKGETCPPTLPPIGDPDRFVFSDDADPPDHTCGSHDCYARYSSSTNSQDLFGYQLSEVRNIATYYNNTVPDPMSGVTWIDVPTGGTLQVTGGGSGSGVLIVNGNAHFAGNYEYRGIIYVLGTLTIPGGGNFESYGSIIVAEDAGVDYINGSPELHWNQTEISNALGTLNAAAGNLVSMESWKEQ